MKISSSMRQDFATYGVGYFLAATLTCISFACVFFRLFSPAGNFTIILILGLFQIIVHMRCFLHVSLNRSARADLQLVLFSVVIILLMVGGTLGILYNQLARMM